MQSINKTTPYMTFDALAFEIYHFNWQTKQAADPLRNATLGIVLYRVVHKLSDTIKWPFVS